MALMTCSECGFRTSTRVQGCLRCGHLHRRGKSTLFLPSPLGSLPSTLLLAACGASLLAFLLDVAPDVAAASALVTAALFALFALVTIGRLASRPCTSCGTPTHRVWNEGGISFALCDACLTEIEHRSPDP